MKLNKYQELAERTADGLGPTERLINFSLGLCGEAGETGNMIKKHLFHGHLLNHFELAKELGDCLWYIATLATTIGFNLEQIAEMNIEKLKKRYPEGFSQERSINREE